MAHVTGCDFTRLDALEEKLAECRLDMSAPTILIAECVFVYLQPEKVTAFLQWAKDTFTGGLALLNHEQLNMNDRYPIWATFM